MNNDKISELYKKIEAQDKIINTQALEIARLKEQLTMLVQDDERDQEIIIKLGNRIDKAIEYIKDLYDVRFTDKDKRKLLEILEGENDGKIK